jgi:hypothetical protein
MYSKFAEDEDKEMTEHWNKDPEGIIIFVRPEANFQLCTSGESGD